MSYRTNSLQPLSQNYLPQTYYYDQQQFPNFIEAPYYQRNDDDWWSVQRRNINRGVDEGADWMADRTDDLREGIRESGDWVADQGQNATQWLAQQTQNFANWLRRF